MKLRRSEEWRRDLWARGEAQDGALADLRGYLLRAERHALYRSHGRLGHLGGADLEAVAEDCAQEALVAILAHLDDCRGDSRFTTWAYRSRSTWRWSRRAARGVATWRPLSGRLRGPSRSSTATSPSASGRR